MAGVHAVHSTEEESHGERHKQKQQQSVLRPERQPIEPGGALRYIPVWC
jgi:hypothetical protein